MPYRPRPTRRSLRGAHRRGYTREWQALAAAAIAAQPWCTDCGATEDLTGDHPIALANGGHPLQVSEVRCRSCNSARGAG
jgi:5-methylcytosine-specific restriction protein A